MFKSCNPGSSGSPADVLGEKDVNKVGMGLISM